MSDLKTGRMRGFVMTLYDMLPHLEDWKDMLLKHLAPDKSSVAMARPNESGDPKPKAIKMLHRSYSMTKPESKSRFVRRPVNLSVGVNPGEPANGAWIQEGDVVEARYKGPPNNQYKWYYGVVEIIASSGWYHVKFTDGKTQLIKADGVRAYMPFTTGGKVDWYNGEKYVKSEVVRVHEDGDTLDIVISKSGKEVNGVFKDSVRRSNTKPVVKKRVTQYY